MKKKFTALLCAAVMMIPFLCVNAEYREDNLITIIDSAVNWKNEHDNPLNSVGTNSSNLYITALRRADKSYDFDAYLSGLDNVAAAYNAENDVSDMQRTVLAVLSSYGDAQNVGGRDLVADSTFFRSASAPLDKDGPDGYAWALIALEAGDYEVPDWATQNKNEIIASLLSYQNGDGSFGNGVLSTATAVAALAPYAETLGGYTIVQNETGWTIDLSPGEAVRDALTYLSETQMKDGDWGDLNSTAMTIIALDAVGIDCETSSEFSARGGNAIDGLMSYKNSDGGFSDDKMNSDGESTSYALCALASHLRFKQGKADFFRLSASDIVSPTIPTQPPTDNTPATATTSPTQQPTETPTPKPTPTSTPKPTPTARPSATPRAAVTPSASTPKSTMRPTRTAAPAPSISPSTRPTLAPTPRPTKRPALVGPVEMPGPMPSTDPEPDLLADGGSKTMHKSGAGKVVAIVLIIIVLLLVAAVVTLTTLKKKGKLKSDSLLGRLMGVKPNPEKEFSATPHRRTEEHRRFEQRERYTERRRYSHRS